MQSKVQVAPDNPVQQQSKVQVAPDSPMQQAPDSPIQHQIVLHVVLKGSLILVLWGTLFLYIATLRAHDWLFCPDV